MKVIAWIVSFMAWLQIVAVPLIVGLIISVFIYKSHPTRQGLVICLFVSTLGLIIGIIIATVIWKKRGTVDFISRVSASEEYDDLKESK